jgi:hypothetical protein
VALLNNFVRIENDTVDFDCRLPVIDRNTVQLAELA